MSLGTAGAAAQAGVPRSQPRRVDFHRSLRLRPDMVSPPRPVVVAKQRVRARLGRLRAPIGMRACCRAFAFHAHPSRSGAAAWAATRTPAAHGACDVDPTGHGGGSRGRSQSWADALARWHGGRCPPRGCIPPMLARFASLTGREACLVGGMAGASKGLRATNGSGLGPQRLGHSGTWRCYLPHHDVDAIELRNLFIVGRGPAEPSITQQDGRHG